MVDLPVVDEKSLLVSVIPTNSGLSNFSSSCRNPFVVICFMRTDTGADQNYAQ